MIIKSIYIKNFGKLKGQKIEFTHGLNIVYGENEAGKSTIQGFIKAMLYGLNNKRVKDIRINDRVRFMPLSGEKASGEIIFNHNDEELIVERFFGVTKKEDEIKVRNNLTGEELTQFKKDDLGKELLGLNSEGFNNTLLIKQLGSGMNNSKEDELINKISNTLQSGEEGISYQKVKSNLEELKKQLVTPRKGGKLDLLRVKYYNLLDEKHKKQVLNEENIESELRLLDLKNHRDFLNNELNKLEIAKKYLKKLKLQSEYKEITTYLVKSKSLKEEKNLVEGELETFGNEVNEEFLITLKEEAKVYFNILDLWKEREVELSELQKVMDIKKEILKEYNILEELPDNIQEKVLELSLEEKTLKENFNIVSELKDELKILKHKERVLENRINANRIDKEFKEDIENNLTNYELKLRDIKSSIGENKLDFNVYENIDRVKKETIIVNSILLLILLIELYSIYKIGAGEKTYYSIIALGGIAFGTIILRIRNKILKKLNDLLIQRNIVDNVKRLKEDIINIEQNLSKYTTKIGAKSYEDFIGLIKDYNLMNNQLEEIRNRIVERSNSFKKLNGEYLIEKVNKNKQVIESLLRVTSCSSLEDLISYIKEYKNERLEIDKIKIAIEEKEKGLEHLQQDLEAKEYLIRTKLKEINLNHISIENIFTEIEKIFNKINRRNSLEQSLKTTDEGYKLLLKDRDVEDLEEELKNFIYNTENFSYENDEQIEDEIKDKNIDLLNTEKEIKDVEHYINKSMIATRSISIIDEDINLTLEEINKYEKQLKGIELALSALEESFKEIQKSFGPVLNKRVSSLFSGLTNGKYDEVKVSDSYELVVRDFKTKSLVNISYLSNGTWDQVYLSLRLAITDLIFKKQTVPIILDESFSQYDDNRLKNILKFLCKEAKNKQIIMFTCQKRELEILKDELDINIINI